jgi:tetratricopeptide (TPR) repeat protein
VAPTQAEAELQKARADFERRAYDSAIARCKGALALVDKEMSGVQAQRQRAAILEFLSEITDVSGNWVDALLYLDGVTQIAVSLNDNKLAVESLIKAGKVVSKKGKWEDALRKFDRAEQLSRKQGIHRYLARALVGKGIVLWRQGAHADAAHQAETAAKIGEGLGDNQIQGEALALIGSVRYDQGNYPASIEALERAMKFFDATKDLYEVARVLNNIGETYRAMGDNEAAIKNLEACLRVSEESGNRRNAGYALMNIADCKVRLGDSKGAKAYATKADAIFATLEDKYALANISMVWAKIHAGLKENANAKSCFDKALEIMSVLAIPYDMGIVQMEYGRFLSKAVGPEDGRAMLKRAGRSFELAGAKEMAARVQKEMQSIA